MILDQDPREIVGYLWLGGGIVWLIGAFRLKRTIRRQSPRSRWLQVALAFAAFEIGFSRQFDFGSLAKPVISGSVPLQSAGLALTAAGIALGVWARFALGSNWSGGVTVKQGHALIEKGPYALVRHPIYSGCLLAFAGTAIVFREMRLLIAFGLVLVLLVSKISIEEEFMTQEFGAKYPEYKQRVKALVPFVY